MWRRLLKDVRWALWSGTRTVLRTEPGANDDLRKSCRGEMEVLSPKLSLHELKQRLLQHEGLTDGCNFVATRYDGEIYTWFYQNIRVTYLRTIVTSRAIAGKKHRYLVVVLKLAHTLHR